MEDMASNCSVINQDINREKIAGSKSNLLFLRYRKARKCFGSKAALLVLLWNFLVQLVLFFFQDLDSYRIYIININIEPNHIISVCSPLILVSFFCPLAGLLADIKFGRYKIVITSLWMLVAGTPFVLSGFALLVSIPQFNKEHKVFFALASTGGLLAAIGLVLFLCNFVAFSANIIQFGLDQLHDSPAEDQVIFIKWYIWTFQTAWLIQYCVILQTAIYREDISLSLYYYILGFLLTIITVFLIGLLYITFRYKKWFFTNYRIINPYKMVYKITMFACKHKTPVNRSAFTFCEDEIPSGLDLGKAKYGGPFTTEQVEDVKAFYGILKILFTFGIVFFLEFAANKEASIFKVHTNLWTSGLQENFIDHGLIYRLAVVFLYPIYLTIVRPLISYYTPQSLYKMGLTMLVYILVILTFLGMDFTAHAVNPEVQCMLTSNLLDFPNTTFSINTEFLGSSFYYMIIIQQTVYAFSNVMVLTSMYEFIFAQCPHAMKGFMVGLSFTISGLYRVLGSLFIVPFLFYSDSISSPSCGTVYYSANIVIGLVALMVFLYQVKRYKHRMRDEPCHVHRYVEEYYSKIMNERFSCD